MVIDMPLSELYAERNRRIARITERLGEHYPWSSRPKVERAFEKWYHNRYYNLPDQEPGVMYCVVDLLGG